jgi:redox-sensitive bicupin YhaK (pirin superfamily)
MEILTYVVSGEIQAMAAGIGIWHSEINRSATEPVHPLQIGLQPRQSGLTPG